MNRFVVLKADEYDAMQEEWQRKDEEHWRIRREMQEIQDRDTQFYCLARSVIDACTNFASNTFEQLEKLLLATTPSKSAAIKAMAEEFGISRGQALTIIRLIRLLNLFDFDTGKLNEQAIRRAS